MKSNEIISLKFRVEYNRTGIKNLIKELLLIPYKKIYSYIIKNDFVNNVKKEWIVQINIMNVEKYNTINISDIIDEITDKLLCDLEVNNKDLYLCYKQPSLEIMDELYLPLMLAMARKQSKKWPIYEFDDLLQICRLAMCELYNKKYYIHKGILEKAFVNKILMEMRKRKKDSCLVSLQAYEKEEFDDDYIDMFEDTNAIIKRERQDELDAVQNVIEEIKPIIVDMIGERRYEMLLRDFANKSVTQADQSVIRRIRLKLNKYGKDLNWFKNKFKD